MSRAARVVGNIFIIAVLALLAGVVVELVARVIDLNAGNRRQGSTVTKETVDKIVKNLVIAYDGRYTAQEILKLFPLVQDQLKYKPWIQIGNADHNNPFSVVEQGIRKTSGSAKCAKGSSRERGAEDKPKVIWFYGGSTTYGIGVPWWDTIPSKFVEEADQRGSCVTVVNFGVPYHFSRQEAIYFATNLMTEPAPDAVVFIDGLNEFFQPGSAIRNEPFFTPTLDKLVPIGPDPGAYPKANAAAQSLPSRFSSFFRNLHIVRKLGFLQKTSSSDAEREEAYSNRNVPESKELSTETEVAQAIADRYLATRSFISKLCDSYGTRCFQFLQPVAAVDYAPLASEVVTEVARKLPEPANRFVAGYSIMRKAFKSRDARCGAEGLEQIDLSALFKDYDGIPYVDYGHYAPRANKLIAAEIARCVLAQP